MEHLQQQKTQNMGNINTHEQTNELWNNNIDVDFEFLLSSLNLSQPTTSETFCVVSYMCEKHPKNNRSCNEQYFIEQNCWFVVKS